MADDFIFGITSFTEEIIRKRQLELRGLWHGHRLVPRDPEPEQPVRLHLSVGTEVSGHAVWCYYTTDGSEPRGAGGQAENGTAVALQRCDVAWDDLVWGYVEEWQGTIPGQPNGTLVRYIVEADGRYAAGGEGSATETRVYAYAVDRWRAPDWVRDAVMYYVMPDRFYPGDGRQWLQTDDLSESMGGTLRGLREKLPYLQDLGFNCLWLMPFYQSPSYHKYDATDFYQVDERLGSKEDLRELVAAAHARGMRVIMDFVTNHTSNHHPWFLAAQADLSSPYHRWFTFDHWPDQFRGFLGVQSMPQINLEYQPARRYLLEFAQHLITEYGLDGYDLDYTLGPSHNFWAEFGQAVRAVSPDVLTVAEGVTSPPFLLSYQGRIDGCLDFAWCQAARETFASGERSVVAFERFLRRHEAFFPEGFVMPLFIDNQNMSRFLWVARGDARRLRLASACLYSLSQPVSVYSGTEVGLSQLTGCEESLHPSRLAMPWGEAQDQELLAWFRRLGQARHAHPALRRGRRVPLLADDARQLLAYAKVHGNDQCLVLLHAGEGEVRAEVAVTPGAYRDLLSDERLPAAGGVLTMPLGPWQARILVLEA